MKPIKDCGKMDIVGGKLTECKKELESLKNFIKRWEEKINRIKELSLDNKQSLHIAQDFIKEAHMKFYYVDSLKNKSLLLDQVGHDLFLALFIANSNYRKENKNFWSLFWKDKLKLPPLHFHKPW